LGVYRGKVVREGEYYSDWEISYEVDPPPRMEDIIPASILDQVDDRCKQALCQRWRGWHADGGSVEYIGLSSRGVVYLEVVEAEALMAVAIAQSGRMAAFPVPRREMNADLYYVDVPKKDADGDWTNVREFGSFDEASEFVQGEFGATVDGWVCLISAG
jgi:hypothetical protein